MINRFKKQEKNTITLHMERSCYGAFQIFDTSLGDLKSEKPP
jgi:hypothetical protein